MIPLNTGRGKAVPPKLPLLREQRRTSHHPGLRSLTSVAVALMKAPPDVLSRHEFRTAVSFEASAGDTTSSVQTQELSKIAPPAVCILPICWVRALARIVLASPDSPRASIAATREVGVLPTVEFSRAAKTPD